MAEVRRALDAESRLPGALDGEPGHVGGHATTWRTVHGRRR